MEHIALGIKRDIALDIVQLTRHQYYYQNKPGKVGRPASQNTRCRKGDQTILVDNQVVVDKIVDNHRDPDLLYGHRKMTSALQLYGYYINHKKVYRLSLIHI